MKKELVCISCPIGCRLKISGTEDGELIVAGNQCPKGVEYAREEVNAPKRIVTTTVTLKGNERLRVPVRTNKALPIENIEELLKQLHGLSLKAPVSRGDVIIEDFHNTGVNVIASLSM